MNIDNQSGYWDKVALTKTFTHPLDLSLLERSVANHAHIVDYGCGYGRLTHELIDNGYTNVKGYDTSAELIKRGVASDLPLHHIATPSLLREKIQEGSVDCVLLFAVLTCIPSNKGQEELLQLLSSLLKPGGILYISDYYLQSGTDEVQRYRAFNDDEWNFGVFTLPEGVTFRHHTRTWVSYLLRKMAIVHEQEVPVTTMNGKNAKAFQIIAQKM